MQLIFILHLALRALTDLRPYDTKLMKQQDEKLNIFYFQPSFLIILFIDKREITFVKLSFIKSERYLQLAKIDRR